jgi:hypothetical protein
MLITKEEIEKLIVITIIIQKKDLKLENKKIILTLNK